MTCCQNAQRRSRSWSTSFEARVAKRKREERANTNVTRIAWVANTPTGDTHWIVDYPGLGARP